MSYSVPPIGATHTAVVADPGGVGLTPEAIMLMVRRQLDEMDGQIQSSIAAIENRRAEANSLGAKISELRELDRLMREAGDMVDGESVDLTKIDEDGPGYRLLREHLGMTEGLSEEHQLPTLRRRLLDEYGISATGNDMDMSVIEQRISELSEEQRRINSGNEMTMMQLQSAMQMRSQIIQLGSNMLAAGDDASGTIIGNLR